MTAIVGLVDDGDVWIGGDSAGVSGWSLTHVRQPKVFRSGQLLIGYTSSFRMGQLLKHQPPGVTQIEHLIGSECNESDLLSVIAETFIPWCRAIFKDGGYATKEKEGEIGGQFLVGYLGRLFRIESDYSILEAEHSLGESSQYFDAVGCGADAALGSLFTSSPACEPKHRVRTALESAEHLSAGVRGPFTILKLEKS